MTPANRGRISWCLQETAFGQRQDDPEGSSPERRRLRFSFQINDVKDPNRLCRPPCLAPVAGGGGVLVASVFRVNRPFQAFCSAPAKPGLERKNHPGPAEGLPSQVRSDSIEVRECSQTAPLNQVACEPLETALRRPRPESGV